MNPNRTLALFRLVLFATTTCTEIRSPWAIDSVCTASLHVLVAASIEQVTVVVRNLADPKADLLDQDGIAAELEDAATTGRPDLAPGDLNNDGIAEILVGAGANGNGQVRRYNGANRQVIDALFAFTAGSRERTLGVYPG